MADFRQLGGIPPCVPFFFELSKLICLYMVSVEAILKEKLWSVITLFRVVNIDGWFLYFSMAIWTGPDRCIVESNRSLSEDKFKLLTAFLKNSLSFSAISRSLEKILSSLTNVIFSEALFVTKKRFHVLPKRFIVSKLF